MDNFGKLVTSTEQPLKIAFGLPDGGRTDIVSDYQIVDELIHELGHNMFLGHSSSQCQKPGMTFAEKQKCCEQSPNKNDVMSYCRDRNAVDENLMFKFEACNLRMIKEKIVPAMLNGENGIFLIGRLAVRSSHTPATHYRVSVVWCTLAWLRFRLFCLLID